MTTVIIKGRYGAKDRETALVSALTPDSFSHGGGQVERLVSATDLHAEVDRIFQEITRVSSMHKTRAALKTEGA